MSNYNLSDIKDNMKKGYKGKSFSAILLVKLVYKFGTESVINWKKEIT